MIKRARHLWPQIDGLGRTVREHAADAIGVALAAARPMSRAPPWCRPRQSDG